MRDLALWLGESGHDVTYLTMRHWDSHEPPTLANVRVLGLVDAGRVYKDERRTLGPPLSFGYAVWRHLARHGHDYDVVHAASFPYFSVLGAALRQKKAWLPPRDRLARGLGSQLLAHVRGEGHGNSRLARAAPLHPARASRLLHVARAGPSSAGRGLPGCAGRASRHLRGAGAVQLRRRGRPGTRRLCRPSRS